MKKLISTIALVVLLHSIAHGKPTAFVGSMKEVEGFLQKEEKWQKSELKIQSEPLGPNDQNDLSISSADECGTRVCRSYIFSKESSGHFRLIGRIEGRVIILPSISHGKYDIRTETGIGNWTSENLATLYRYNGKEYMPIEEK